MSLNIVETLARGPIVYGVSTDNKTFNFVFIATRNGSQIEAYQLDSTLAYQKVGFRNLPSDMDIEHGLDVIVEQAEEFYTDLIALSEEQWT